MCPLTSIEIRTRVMPDANKVTNKPSRTLKPTLFQSKIYKSAGCVEKLGAFSFGHQPIELVGAGGNNVILMRLY